MADEDGNERADDELGPSIFGGSASDNILSGPLYYRILTVTSALFLFLMMALTFADVIGRYFLNAPITGAAEFIAFFLGLTVFTAFPLVTRDRTHITVGILERYFKGPVRYVQRLVVMIGTLGVAGFIAWLMYDQAETMREGNFLTEYLDLPKAPMVYVLSALAAVATIIFIGVIWGYLRRGGDPEEVTSDRSSVG